MGGDRNRPNLGYVIHSLLPVKASSDRYRMAGKTHRPGGALMISDSWNQWKGEVEVIFVMHIIMITSRATRLHIGRHLCTTH